jgi:hypothetical protein
VISYKLVSETEKWEENKVTQETTERRCVRAIPLPISVRVRTIHPFVFVSMQMTCLPARASSSHHVRAKALHFIPKHKLNRVPEHLSHSLFTFTPRTLYYTSASQVLRWRNVVLFYGKNDYVKKGIRPRRSAPLLKPLFRRRSLKICPMIPMTR